MCGIYGLVVPSRVPLHNPELVLCMGPLLRHRGPDGSGVLRRPHAVFGAERLRIVDLDARADQPFEDPSGRIWLVCNGEVYNSAELRRRFPGYPFRSRSDVEVIIPLYLERGVEGLAELSGMFGLALWDETTRTLVLARDRAGEKPLFYATAGGAMAFASEVQPLLECLGLPRTLDQTALSAFCTLGYVPQPRTMFTAVRAVPAGSAVMVQPDGCRTFTYWDPAQIEPGDRPPHAEEDLREVLRGAVRRQLAADVPIGVFTSGGVDSSLVAALAVEALGPDRIQTFTARFTAPTYDESSYARALSRRLGTQHTDVAVDEPALALALDTITSRIAEPIADPAVLPTLLLARRAREDVSVVLGGEGADELFGGYPTYLGHVLSPSFARLPRPIRRALTRAISALPDSATKVPLSTLFKRFIMSAHLPWQERHLAWCGTGLDPAALGVPTPSTDDWFPPSRLPPLPPLPPRESVLASAMLLDYRTYLGDQLLVKLDRATMLVALEARSPYLDPDVTQFALRLDPALKVQGWTTKVLLKRAARPWLPRRIIRRRKRGLSVPIASWLRRGLLPEAQRLLAPERLRRQGLVSDVYVGKLLAEHAGGWADHARGLWTLIVLQRWLERWTPEA
ncbi:MAG: asparagine synthase (glutamine-hydrolyzing) [Gemmatimonadetes bacterium]|nr:asparagine synthase (glutamine-hydrolyzing) [Gemmatimonadota bacterium]